MYSRNTRMDRAIYAFSQGVIIDYRQDSVRVKFGAKETAVSHYLTVFILSKPRKKINN